MRVGFEFERIIAVSNVMAMSFGSSHDIEDHVEQPVKNEQHFYLLPEMDLFMADKLRLVAGLPCYPDEDEEREAGIIVEYLFSGIDLIRQHIAK